MKQIKLYNTEVHTGCLILVNERNEYREQLRPELVTIARDAPDVLLDRRAATLLMKLLSGIHGWNQISMVSGWRSFEEQKSIWDASLLSNGEEFTKKYVAVPGHSEHQTGLAIDLGLKQDCIDFICPEFPYDGICDSFRRRAAFYGFVERYPAHKEAVTGIGHEPWHFRYVGVPHAFIMEENNLVLEEYLDFLRDYPVGRPLIYQEQGLNISVSYQQASSGAFTVMPMEKERPYTVSGDNIHGFILTEWRASYV